MEEEEDIGNVIALLFNEVTAEFREEDVALPPQHRAALSLSIVPPSTLSHERVYELISCVSNPDASAPEHDHKTCRVFAMKMEEDGFQLGAHQELQPADYPTSSLASLCLTEEAAVISRSADHMVDNPEPHSGFPEMMSSQSTQSKQQKESTNVEPCPAVQGKVYWAIDADILVRTTH